MQTSSLGIAALEHDEGVVLRAYRCPAGIWTIGAGLTAASGVVRPKAGMVITRAEATNLLRRALRENYEPAVSEVMPAAKQHEFDAGVSFHFNTGAIRRASWVKLWRRKAPRADVAAKFLIWNKGGGRVLPGLVARRERELQLLQDGVYPVAARAAIIRPPRPAEDAVWVLPLSKAERTAALDGFRALGYPVGGDDVDAFAEGVRKFQRDHGLTVDGIIGRATLSTLQRRLDAAARAKPATAVAASSGAVTAAPALSPADPTVEAVATVLGQAGPILAAVALLYGLYLCWTYRDAIAAKVGKRFPMIATFLRSF